MKYIMKDGAFYNKEANETVATLTGTLAGIRTLENNGQNKLQIGLKRQDDEGQDVVDTLTLRLYREPALKILRAMFSIMEIISGKVFTISLEKRDGREALLSVSADGEVISPRNCGEAFAYEERIFIDKAVRVLKNCIEFAKTVLVYSNADRNYPDDGNVEAVCDYIREMRRLGRTGELNVKKTTFSIPAAARGYLKALYDLQSTRAFRFTDNPAEIDAIWTAFTEDLPENTSEMTDGSAGEGHEEEC